MAEAMRAAPPAAPAIPSGPGPAAAPAPAPAGVSGGAARWADALAAAALFALDPHGLGGVVLRALPGPVRDRWLAALRRLLPEGMPQRRLPPEVPDGRLLGGLDLAAALAAGRPVAERGLLAEADGGVLILAMAERAAPGMAARLGAALDRGEVAVERDGFAFRAPARFGLVALDEGMSPEEGVAEALHDRLAFALALDGIGLAEAAAPPGWDAAALAAARARLPGVTAEEGMLQAICGTAAALGIASLRAPLLALRAARAAAALAGRDHVAEEDVALAARLVLAPRATILPAPQETEEEEGEPPPPEEARADGADAPPPDGETPDPDSLDPEALQDLVLAAAAAAIPPDLLARLRLAGGALRRGGAQGKAGATRLSARRGRPVGTRAGELRAGARLSLIATLRAAAPWQALRRAARADMPGAAPRIEVRREDVRITRFRQNAETVAIFLVDASGSAALARLAEAKGAVEMLLADCYVRRDRVALIAFRGRTAELLLPPTNSLVRARRSLAGLPGGGGTPLATALDAAAALADAVRRKGQTPLLVLLTDGKANVARDGTPGRPQAEAEALEAARRLRALGAASLLVDTAPRAQPQARALAEAMGARYLPLPLAGAEALSRAVRAVVA